MPRRKKPLIEEEQGVPEGPEISLPTEDDIRREEEVQAFAQSLGPSVCKVSIYRLDKSGRFAYVGSLPPAGISESFIQQNYGGGEFIVRLLDEGGRYLKQRSVVIEEPKREVASTAAPGLDLSGRIQIEMLQQQMIRQHEMLLKMIERSGTSGSSATELAAALVQLRTLVKPTEAKPTDPLESIRSAISLLNEGIKLAGKTPRVITNSGESKMEMLRGILEAVPAVASAVSGLRFGQGTPVQVAAPVAPGAQVSNPPVNPQSGIEQFPFLRETFAYLKAKAVAGKSVELVIDWIAENLDEPPWLSVTQRILAMPFEQLGNIDPDTQVEPLRTWFYNLYEGLKEIVEERAAQASSESTDQEPAGRKGGN